MLSPGHPRSSLLASFWCTPAVLGGRREEEEEEEGPLFYFFQVPCCLLAALRFPLSGPHLVLPPLLLHASPLFLFGSTPSRALLFLLEGQARVACLLPFQPETFVQKPSPVDFRSFLFFAFAFYYFLVQLVLKRELFWASIFPLACVADIGCSQLLAWQAQPPPPLTRFLFKAAVLRILLPFVLVLFFLAQL